MQFAPLFSARHYIIINLRRNIAPPPPKCNTTRRYYSSKPPTSYYQVLRVAPTASEKEIRDAYVERSKLLHPDRNKHASSHEQFTALQHAYQVLKDAESRREHDFQIGLRRRPVDAANQYQRQQAAGFGGPYYRSSQSRPHPFYEQHMDYERYYRYRQQQYPHASSRGHRPPDPFGNYQFANDSGTGPSFGVTLTFCVILAFSGLFLHYSSYRYAANRHNARYSDERVVLRDDYVRAMERARSEAAMQQFYEEIERKSGVELAKRRRTPLESSPGATAAPTKNPTEQPRVDSPSKKPI